MCTVLYRILVQYSTKSVNINNNKYLLASVYERHNEKLRLDPLKNRFCFFLSYWRDLLASVYERSNTAFAFKKT
jgi:hypothetical protein